MRAVLVVILSSVMSISFAGSKYPPRAKINSGQISLSCAVAAGVAVEFINDKELQVRYKFPSKFMDGEKYAASCIFVGKKIVRVVI